MKQPQIVLTIAMAIIVWLTGCSDQHYEVADNRAVSIANDSSTAQMGFEILQVYKLNKLRVWVNRELSKEEFDSIELPLGWFKNQPRIGDADSAFFSRSPEAIREGEFIDKTLFGHSWRHNAMVIGREIELPEDEGLLKGYLVSKYHHIVFKKGRKLKILISPTGDHYVRVSRDALRTTNNPTIPSKWQITTIELQHDLVLELPNPTVNIRMDNEDSFQGPITIDFNNK
jgi:hypothetical protein